MNFTNDTIKSELSSFDTKGLALIGCLHYLFGSCKTCYPRIKTSLLTKLCGQGACLGGLPSTTSSKSLIRPCANPVALRSRLYQRAPLALYSQLNLAVILKISEISGSVSDPPSFQVRNLKLWLNGCQLLVSI